MRENDFDFDAQWDYFANVGGGGSTASGCLDGNCVIQSLDTDMANIHNHCNDGDMESHV